MTFLKRYIYSLSRVLWLLVKPLSIGVRILMVQDDQVLLVKHVYQDQWFLPGGLIEHGETLEEAIRREAAEEVGATLHDLALFGAYSHPEFGKMDHVIVFLSRDFSLNGYSDDEIERYAFFDLHNLPAEVSLGSRKQIERFLNPESYPAYGAW